MIFRIVRKIILSPFSQQRAMCAVPSPGVQVVRHGPFLPEIQTNGHGHCGSNCTHSEEGEVSLDPDEDSEGSLGVVTCQAQQERHKGQ